MKRLTTLLLAFVAISLITSSTTAKGDDFGDVVKAIERFYQVKHKGIPFLAKAGIRTATVAARLAGGSRRRLAEAGSVKVAYFEDQNFKSANGFNAFKTTMNTMLAQSWSPLIQVVSPKDTEQTYIYLREAGTKFNVLVINLAQREGSVIQVTLSPQSLAALIKNPDEMGQTISAEATIDHQE
jgi:DNA-binding LacI/PurR family transcriptional regulator